MCNFVLYIVVISDAANFVISPCVSLVASGGRCSDERVLVNGGGGPDEEVLKQEDVEDTNRKVVVVDREENLLVDANGGRALV